MKAEKYISDVKTGKQLACKWVKLAIQRHLKDIKTGKSRGLYFDPLAGERAIKFFSFLKHYKGSHAKQSFELLPWQQALIYILYGWKRTDGSRRFKYAYIEVARKNGKTTLAAGNCLYALTADGEEGAEIYTAATKKDQAKIAFNDAKEMVDNSPEIKKIVEIFQHNLHILNTASKMEAVSSDSNTLDGLNPHFALIDEYHAHKDAHLYNVMKSGMGSRKQPMLFTITTAGFNKMGPCYALRKTCTEILEGIKEDDSQFAIIYTLDEGDDYLDEKNWIKANPSLGHAITYEFLRQEVIQAKNNPTELVNLLTKNFNTWTDASETWVEDSQWLKCHQACDFERLRLMEGFAGLDLASTRDINSFSLVLQDHESGKYHLRTWYWVPRDTMKARIKRDGVRYDLWVEQGWLKVTEGNVTDYRSIKADIERICEQYNVNAIAFDRWNSSQLVIELTEAGLNMQPFGQGFASLSQPSKTLENWIYKKVLSHDNNPITRWMLSNVELSKDPSGNIKPDKAKSAEKIDGVVATVMAIGIMLILAGEMANNGPSVYENSQLISI